MTYMADYSDIDPIIYAWAQKHSLHIYTLYKDYEVLSVDVLGNAGARYQIWVDAPDMRKGVDVHVGNYKKKRADYKTSVSGLKKTLETAYSKALSWDEDVSKD